jgi:hypothetical protein
MDKSNIKEGMRVKNYRVMCGLVGEEVKNGSRSKAYQFKEWKRFIDFHTEGHEIVIDAVYEAETPKIDKAIKMAEAKRDQSAYIIHFEIQIMNYLALSGYDPDKPNFVFIPIYKIHKMMGMVNDRYLTSREAINSFIADNKDKRLSKFDINTFYQMTNNKVRQITEDALHNMATRCYIVYSKTYQIVINGRNRKEYATKEEVVEINEIKRQILRKLGLKSEYDIYNSGKNKTFYMLLNKELKQKFGWDSVWAGYEIGFHGNAMNEKIEDLMDEAKAARAKLAMNEAVYTYIQRSSRENQDKHNAEVAEQKANTWGDTFKIGNKATNLHENFAENMRILSDLFIRLDWN